MQTKLRILIVTDMKTYFEQLYKNSSIVIREITLDILISHTQISDTDNLTKNEINLKLNNTVSEHLQCN